MPFLNIGNLNLSGKLTVEPLFQGPTFSLSETSKLTSTARTFGYVLSMTSSTLAVGAYAASTVSTYELVDNKWTKISDIVKTGRFGAKVAVTDDWLAISDNPVSGNGTVWIYKRNGARSWGTTEFAVLSAPVGTTGNGFGASVALDGNTLVVGHRQANSVGGVHVYVFNGTSWVIEGNFLTVNASEVRASTSQNLGSEVSIDGDLLIAGGPGDTLGRGNGVAFVSKRTGTSWSAPVVIKPTTTFLDGFGWTVKAKNNYVLVGAPYGNASERIPGRAFLYDCTGALPVLEETFTVRTDRSTLIQDTLMTTNDSFGWAVDMNNDHSVVLVSSLNRNSRGIVYAYEKFNNVWGPSALPDSAMLPNPQVSNGRFGSAIGFTSSGAVIGAYGANASYWFK